MLFIGAGSLQESHQWYGVDAGSTLVFDTSRVLCGLTELDLGTRLAHRSRRRAHRTPIRRYNKHSMRLTCKPFLAANTKAWIRNGRMYLLASTSQETTSFVDPEAA